MNENRNPIFIITTGNVSNINSDAGNSNSGSNNININQIPENNFVVKAFEKLTFSQQVKVLQLIAKLLKENDNNLL